MDEAAVETKALENTPFFARLSRDDLESILEVGRPATFDASEVICEQGEVGDAMYVLLEGTAEVDVGGRYHTLKPGDFFGEMALIAARKRMATVTAVEPVRALLIPADGFQAFLLEHPRVAVSMLAALVERLREVEQRIDALMAI
jgi:CRP-like cAMP-binding protein